ncbi:MAG: phosphatidylserine decarboxylase [Kiritimatiellae bacterium]|nr:phosphatidylserine decarboxylase [Kiritimatiellia bacterium]
METKPDFSNGAYLFPHVNQEGVRFGVIALVLATLYAVGVLFVAHCVNACLGGVLGFMVVPFYLLAYGVFLFFRDPERYPPEDEKAILSPADGRVCLVQETTLPEELLKDLPAGCVDPAAKYARVSVFMSVFNVHVNRMPTAARILKKAYVPGKFLNASLDKASKDNERCCYLMEAPGGEKYGVVQIAGLVAKRIVPFAKDGDRLARAERFGLIRFGSRLDVYLPSGVSPEVRVGQIMTAGESVLGHLK